MSDGGLQFEKAEFADARMAPATCGYCQKPLEHAYYGVDDRPACPACKDEIAARGTQGSGLGRFIRASIFGAVAGGLGAGLWYAVRAITGLEIGLISILVGLAVGVAVRAGSHGRGGWRYQALAVFLTYTSIVSTYVPEILTGLKGQWAEREKAEAAAVAPTPTSAKTSPSPEVPTAGQAMLALGVVSLFVIAIAYVAPFLGGFENIIGLAIIAFGLWEAWKINRRVEPAITGPFAVAPPPTTS